MIDNRVISLFFQTHLGHFWYLILSLSLPLASCQTTDTANDEANRARQVLDSQKALVRNALNQGNPQGALQSLRALLRSHPADASLHNLMGLTQLALKHPTRAVDSFQKAYKLDPQGATALNLSSAYIESGDFQKAIPLLKTILNEKEGKPYPYRERLFHNLGYAHVRQGHLKVAERWFREALAENPAFFPSHMELGRVLEATKRPSQAKVTYRRAIDYCQICFEPIYALALIHMREGQPLLARRIINTYQQQKDLTPEDREKAGQLLKLVAANLRVKSKGK